MKRYLSWFLKTALCLVIVMTALLAWRLVSHKNSRVSVESLFVPVGLTGEYRIDDGAWLPLWRDADFGMRAHQRFHFRGRLSSDVEKNMLIMVRIIDLEVHISLNGERIYSFGEPRKRHPLFKSPGNLWGSFLSPGITKADNVEIELRTIYGDDYLPSVRRFVSSFHYGSDEGLWRAELREHGLSFLIGLVTLVLGLLELVAAAEFALLKQPLAARCLYGGGFSVSCGLWLGIQYGFLSLLVPFPALVGTVDVLSFYFLGLFFSLYLGTFLSERRRAVSLAASAFVLFLILTILSLEHLGIRDAYDEPDTLILTVVAAMFASLAMLWCECRARTEGRLKLVFYTTLPVGVGIVMDMFRYMRGGSENTVWLSLGVFIYAVAQWSFTIWQFKENAEASLREEHMKTEMAQSRIAVMLSQIQPHFLYNALATIKSLCTRNPSTAREAIDAFAKYLRANMDSLRENKLILFDDELKHLENYLYIEKLRFGDRLEIVCDLKCRNFWIPALTIQPMVENAVKYGISQKPCGGTVSISTEEAEAWFVVKIADDGCGFDPNAAPNGGRSHIGIENTRSRLKFMCGGRLEIDSALGRGTEVTIYIPKGVKR